MSLDRFRDTLYDLHEDACAERAAAAEHLARADELDQKVAEMQAILDRPRTTAPEVTP